MEAEVLVGAFADLGTGLGKKLDKVHRSIETARPIHRTIMGSGTSLVSGFGAYALAVCTQYPSQGRIWNLRSVHLLAGGPDSPVGGVYSLTQGPSGSYDVGWTEVADSATVAAAAAGSLTINQDYVEGFRVDPAAAWPAGTNLVTISNLNGGTQSFYLPGGTTSPLIVAFPEPVAAPFAHPVINVPAITTGPAYTINAWGRSLGNGVINTAVDLYIGTPPETAQPLTSTGTAPDVAGVVESNLGPLPFHKSFNKGVYWVKPGEQLYATFAQVPGSGTPCVIIARIDEYILSEVEAMAL